LKKEIIITKQKTNIENAENQYFDIINGVLTNQMPNHAHKISGETLRDFISVLKTDFSNLPTLHHLTRENRRRITETLIEYYRLHISGFPGLKSLQVLQEVFE
jgi:DNA repair protein RecO (recombination protein O)